MPRPSASWVPSPEEIRQECIRIRAEKGEWPSSQQQQQRLDLRTIFDFDDDDDEEATDGD